MKKMLETAFRRSLPVVMVAALVSLAIFRGPMLDGVLCVLALAWVLWMAGNWFMLKWPHIRRRFHDRKRRRKMEAAQEARQEVQRVAAKAAEKLAEQDRSLGVLLLRHVGHRITAYLNSAYPGARWRWCVADPADFISHGGVARIELFDVPEFSHAELTFDCYANISVKLVKMVQLEALLMDEGEKAEKPEAVTAPGPDPLAWYELKGREPITNMVADLYSRGYNQMLIKENGEAVAGQDKQVQAKLENLPERKFWPELARVISESGISASEGPDGIIITWKTSDK